MEHGSREFQKAIDYLCREIQKGSVKAGGRLPAERVIAEELQISRNSTREALRSLEHMGIIESVQGSGNYFTGNISKSFSEMIRLLILVKLVTEAEICDFRRTMDQSVCLSIIRRGDFDLSEVERVLSEKTETVEEEIEKDHRFHDLLTQVSDNRFWIELMNAVCDVYREWIDIILRRAERETKEKFHAAHGKILAALKDKDFPRCAKAIDEHYDIIDQAFKQAEV